MECPECHSAHIRKNGKRRGKQNHICVDCKRQFIVGYETTKGYSKEIKRECLKMYGNGMGFRGIERVKGVHHTTVISWVKQVGELLPDAYQPEATPEVGELDELETFVGSKKRKSGCGQPLTTSSEEF
jgi:hypothetical protein